MGRIENRADAATRRLLVVADSDSYVKWGAALASTMPATWTTSLVVLASPVLPSRRQLADALAGTRFTTGDVHVLHLDDLGALVDRDDPHAVLLSLRGPFVRVVAPTLESRSNRPVLLSGFPGLTIPAVPKAVVYREQTDLVVLHSRREVREFRANAADLGVDRRFGLATLPFLADDRIPAGGRGTAGDAGRAAASDRTDLVFAAQAKVPTERDDRVRVLEALAEYARRHPGQRVVVKVRARRGEAQTHFEEHDYADLLHVADGVPSNLVVEDGPMAEKLARANAVVTVSSTTALEAVALRLPTLLLDDFGVSPAMINTVFEGSGLFGSLDDLVHGRFRHADAAWTNDNYFHGCDADDWFGRLDAFAEAREIVPLPRLERRHDLAGGLLRNAYERRRMLGSHDREPLGAAAWGLGLVARHVVRRLRRLQGVGGLPNAALRG
ncbi:DUF6716 putative glycosyltransferase [Agromyces sp. NPDC058484]|uniref:DUF6716 putative glycosyltransferase n=1 Tax=Agromyces sp. NPDC058484 TaxID=3346524 RepID=UPI00365012A5